ncbi:hypothetical protein [Prosthecobacter sp.]|jgi:hypothetical protein|uniref:hypothetical protein n=1 Tax=Prosthecobacter sp. TaxID=1965333 RepID=UPI0037CBABE1
MALDTLNNGDSGLEARTKINAAFDQLNTLGPAANIAITGGTAIGLTALGLRSTGTAFDLTLASSEELTSGRTLSFALGDADRTLTIPATGTAALLGTANIFTALQTMTAAANAAGLNISGSIAGGGVTRSILTIADDWTAATGNTSYPTLLSLEITTGSGQPNFYGDRALRLIQDNVERFYIAHDGSMYIANGVSVNGNYQIIEMPVGWMLRWSNQTCLSRVDHGIILQRSESGTITQTFRVANTVSSTTNWEAGVMDWQTSTNTLRIGTDVGSGGGSARDAQLIRGGVVKINLGANTTDHTQPVKLPSYIVSGLPSASTCGAGSMAFVTDATTTTAYSTVTGGGSNKALVISDGTNWIIH